MAKKGHLNRQKRLSASPIRFIERKAFVWSINTKPGPHSTETSVPLGMVVRDMLKLAATLRETKRMLSTGYVLVDGVARKKHQFPVGLFDTVQVPTLKKAYRLTLDTKGRRCVFEVTGKTENKPVKVTKKFIAKGGVLRIQTHTGAVYSNIDSAIAVGDSVIVKGTRDIAAHVPMKEGAHVFVTGGTHVGEIATVKSILPGTMRRDALVSLKEGASSFQTTERNIMLIDDETAKWIRSHTTTEGSA